MQIPKSYALFCAAVLAASPLGAQNVNADADAKAREALRRKISELEGRPAAPDSSAPSAPAANTPQPAPAPRPATAQNAPVAPPTTVNSDTEAKAREALRQKIADLQNKPAAPAPAVTAAPAPVVVTPEPAPTPTPAPVR